MQFASGNDFIQLTADFVANDTSDGAFAVQKKDRSADVFSWDQKDSYADRFARWAETICIEHTSEYEKVPVDRSSERRPKDGIAYL